MKTWGNDVMKQDENNEIIDHAEVIREIVERKCARCGGGI